ncbi:MAG: hypothetical protein EAZ30_10175 [Betaproteobacteria bacterium]|nr:MAG: hypothetical protein EAZ30_10175 [Betaproteobacteria bacterium]
MSKYHVEVSGALTPQKIESALNGEEALANTFIGSRLWVNAKHKLTNLVEFDELEEPLEPQPGLLTIATVAVDGLTPLWTGPMVVKGSATNVWMYRAEPG